MKLAWAWISQILYVVTAFWLLYDWTFHRRLEFPSWLYLGCLSGIIRAGRDGMKEIEAAK